MQKRIEPAIHLPRIICLMYHRVDDAETDPWGICVSVRHFGEQVRFLTNNYPVISSDQLIAQVANGNIAGNSICITFDDGYVDNYINAKPILEKYNCPATFFIPTAFIGKPVPFWWEELEIIMLHSVTLPHQLHLAIDGMDYVYFFDETALTKEELLLHSTWRWYQLPPTNRCTVFLKIWKKLRPLSNDAINKILDCIRRWAAAGSTGMARRLPMNENQLRDLSTNPLFTIAMHTHSHPDLKGKSKKFQAEEIVACQKIFDKKYGIQCNSLAYPYGRYNDDTITAVRQLGIRACFTTSSTEINALSDLATLGRIQVLDGDSNSLKRQLITSDNAEDL